MGDSLVIEMTAPVGKTEASRDGSVDSIGSSPEPGLVETYAQEEPQQQKRKGGRKPVSPLPLPAMTVAHAYPLPSFVAPGTDQAP